MQSNHILPPRSRQSRSLFSAGVMASKKPDRDDEVAGKSGIDQRVGVLRPVTKNDSDREVRKTGAGEKRFTHSHVPTALSPIWKMKLPGPKVFVASLVTVKTSEPRSVLPRGDTARCTRRRAVEHGNAMLRYVDHRPPTWSQAPPALASSKGSTKGVTMASASSRPWAERRRDRRASAA